MEVSFHSHFLRRIGIPPFAKSITSFHGGPLALVAWSPPNPLRPPPPSKARKKRYVIGVQSRHYDRHDYLVEKRAALEVLHRLLVSKSRTGKVIAFKAKR
jgi:hypothetical protein